MTRAHPSLRTPRVAVIGAGISGLAAALELAHAGIDVLVLDKAGGPGGKMRTLPSAAGPVDAGPTVFTMKPVFDDLFASVDESLEAHLTLHPADILARHHWRGHPLLDLFVDLEQSIEAVRAFAGPYEAQRFAAFTARANLLFDAFEEPVMRAPAPSPLSVSQAILSDALRLAPAMAPLSTLWQALGRSFKSPQLRQLFARYATYVGGSPLLSPALLMLVWASEQRGVWHIEGGMHALAQALERLATARGVIFRYGAEIARIKHTGARASGVVLMNGERIEADAILFNGDPAALAGGIAPVAASPTPRRARSLSAWVWTFAAAPRGLDLSQHSVFFSDNYPAEFHALFKHRALPADPTLYLCAQDRDGSRPAEGQERFQIIMNAPADGDITAPGDSEVQQWQSTVFTRFRDAGLHLDPPTDRAALTTPDQFSSLFPGTGGALYGINPHGAMRTFSRPTARTRVKGLYLCGGGCHPGPGVPMAALSGRHAAAAIIADRASIFPSIQVAMPGGISTG